MLRNRLISCLATALLIAPALAHGGSGIVLDALTKAPIAEALVTADGVVTRSDTEGRFEFTGETLTIGAPGYRRHTLTAPTADHPLEVALLPFTPKGIYLSFYGVGHKGLREEALNLVGSTEVNAIIIDVKGDRGLIPYRSAVPKAIQVGAQQVITVRDIKQLLSELKDRGVYTIGRVVVFKDDRLASAEPQLAIKTAEGEVWRDGQGMAWSDPFRKEVWEYNIEIAVEAAQLGFDEIVFDYVRFPDASTPAYSQPNTQVARTEAINTFLAQARSRLAPHHVYVGASIFGYACWNRNDTQIGQQLEALAKHVDYIAPMLYPSGFHKGIPPYHNPVEYPYEIVYLSLERARQRTAIAGHRFRPWLQAFRDYAFDKRSFTGEPLKRQIEATETFGAGGWMLWNPRNVYEAEGLRPQISVASHP